MLNPKEELTIFLENYCMKELEILNRGIPNLGCHKALFSKIDRKHVFSMLGYVKYTSIETLLDKILIKALCGYLS